MVEEGVVNVPKYGFLIEIVGIYGLVWYYFHYGGEKGFYPLCEIFSDLFNNFLNFFFFLRMLYIFCLFQVILDRQFSEKNVIFHAKFVPFLICDLSRQTLIVFIILTIQPNQKKLFLRQENVIIHITYTQRSIIHIILLIVIINQILQINLISLNILQSISKRLYVRYIIHHHIIISHHIDILYLIFNMTRLRGVHKLQIKFMVLPKIDFLNLVSVFIHLIRQNFF